MNDEQLNEDKFLRENILAEAALAAHKKACCTTKDTRQLDVMGVKYTLKS